MQDCQELDIVAMTTTVATAADAQRLARLLLERRLAACVQVEAGVQSFYRWQDRTCEDAEQRLLLKTVGRLVPAVQALFAEHHPYELPQCVAWPVQASEAYAGWVRGEVAPG